MSRAARVLAGIESRIHELREELEGQDGRGGGRGSDEDGSGGRGRVVNPETDRRLKQNRDD